MKIELTVKEATMLAIHAMSQVANLVCDAPKKDDDWSEDDRVEVRDMEQYPKLEWQLNMMTGRLIASCEEADGSLPLYEVWHNGDDWLAMRASTTEEPIETGSLTKCLDACQEHFMDSIDSDRGVADAARQVS